MTYTPWLTLTTNEALELHHAMIPAQRQRLDDKSGCVWCSSASISDYFDEKFGERICTACRKTRPEYGMISKSNAKLRYLVTDKDMRSLRFIEKPNPSNAKFRDMKLFLLKHVIAAAIVRHGSLSDIEQEKRRREVERFKSRAVAGRLKRPSTEEITSGSAEATAWSQQQAARGRQSKVTSRGAATSGESMQLDLGAEGSRIARAFGLLQPRDRAPHELGSGASQPQLNASSSGKRATSPDPVGGPQSTCSRTGVTTASDGQPEGTTPDQEQPISDPEPMLSPELAALAGMTSVTGQVESHIELQSSAVDLEWESSHVLPPSRLAGASTATARDISWTTDSTVGNKRPRPVALLADRQRMGPTDVSGDGDASAPAQTGTGSAKQKKKKSAQYDTSVSKEAEGYEGGGAAACSTGRHVFPEAMDGKVAAVGQVQRMVCLVCGQGAEFEEL